MLIYVFVHSRFIENFLVGSWAINPYFFRGGSVTLLITNMLGLSFEFAIVPAVGTRGGILVAWRTEAWMITGVSHSAHSLSLKISHIFSLGDWWLTAVYGPHHDQDKQACISELCEVRSRCIGLWLVRGDFNLIYKAAMGPVHPRPRASRVALTRQAIHVEQ
jgi:hypothetical protein